MKNWLYRLLRKSEKYTKTDMVYLVEGGAWLSAGQFVSGVAAFVTSIAFANLLAPEVFGLYKYIISIVSMLTITTLAGMDSAVTQAIARGFDGTLMPALKTKMKWGAIGSGLSLLISIYYYSAGNITLALSFGVVAIFMPFAESFDMYNSLLFGKKKFDTQVIYNIIKKLFALGALVGTVFLTQNIFIIIFVYFASISLPNLFFLYRTRKLYQENEPVDPDADRYGKHLSAIYVISLVAAELDKVLIFQNVGAVELVIYSLALAPTDQIKGLLKNLNSLAMPQFAKRSIEEIKKTIWEKVGLLTVGISGMVMVYILLAPLFFETFFPKYSAAVFYSQILALSLIPAIIAGFLYTILESQKAKEELYEYNTYSSILNIAVLIPLIYFFGIWGAIFAKLLSRSITFIYSVYLIKKI